MAGVGKQPKKNGRRKKEKKKEAVMAGRIIDQIFGFQ